MTYLLQKAIKAFLAGVFTGFRQPSPPAGEIVSPQILIGALPPKRKAAEQGEDYPFVVVRAVEGEDPEEEKPEVEVHLICGTWVPPESDAETGALACHLMGDKIRAALHHVGDSTGILDDRYELQYPVKWRTGVREGEGSEAGSQPHPYYYITVITRWKLPPVNNPLSVTEEVQVYGAGYEG